MRGRDRLKPIRPTTCTGEVRRIDVKVKTRGKHLLLTGDAVACAFALNRRPDGALEDARQWCGADDITLSSG